MVKEMLAEKRQRIAKEAGITLEKVEKHWNQMRYWRDESKVAYLKNMYGKKRLPKRFQRTIDELIDKDYKYTIKKLVREVDNRQGVDRLDDLKPMAWAVRIIGDPVRARRAFEAVIAIMDGAI